MVARKPLPVWSIVAALVLVLGGIGAGFAVLGNSSLDKQALIRIRTRPGSAAAPSAESYGRPRGTPIIPVSNEAVSDPRRKPMR